MDGQKILILFAIVFFVLPFILWMVLRFISKVHEYRAPWQKPLLISAFCVSLTIFLTLILIAVLLF